MTERNNHRVVFIPPFQEVAYKIKTIKQTKNKDIEIFYRISFLHEIVIPETFQPMNPACCQKEHNCTAIVGGPLSLPYDLRKMLFKRF